MLPHRWLLSRRRLFWSIHSFYHGVIGGDRFMRLAWPEKASLALFALITSVMLSA